MLKTGRRKTTNRPGWPAPVRGLVRLVRSAGLDAEAEEYRPSGGRKAKRTGGSSAWVVALRRPAGSWRGVPQWRTVGTWAWPTGRWRCGAVFGKAADAGGLAEFVGACRGRVVT